MNRRLTGQPQPTSPMNETAQDVWVSLLADLVLRDVAKNGNLHKLRRWTTKRT
jgi:hypothetical protein